MSYSIISYFVTVNMSTFTNLTEILHTLASFSISSSLAPKEANPISCENNANAGSANNGTYY